MGMMLMNMVSAAQGVAHGGIAGLLANFILPGVQQPDTLVRSLAVRALGLYCLLGEVSVCCGC